jgi:transposase-like protein
MFLKECEFRFNYAPTKRMLATLKTWAKLHQL